MANWLESRYSLNWANKKTLSLQISQFEKNIISGKETLLALLALMNHWELHCKILSEKRNKEQHTAKDVVTLKPLLQRSEDFKNALKTLCAEELAILKSEETYSQIF